MRSQRSTVGSRMPIGPTESPVRGSALAPLVNRRMQATASTAKAKLKPKPALGGPSDDGARGPGAALQPAGERHQNEGHGRRLTMAFEALEAFPALAESRDRLLSVISRDHVATADVVSAVESDVALIITVLRMANQAQAGRGRIDTVVAAVDLLKPQ